MDIKEQFIRANQTFSDYVALVIDNEWDWRVPSTPDWTVQQLVNHVSDTNRRIIARLAQNDPDDTDDAISLDNTEPAATWLEMAEAVEEAVEKIQNLETLVETPIGDASTQEFLELMVGDHVVHGWDLAHAIGSDEVFDEDLVETACAAFSAHLDEVNRHGVIKPALAAKDSAPPLEKLLALTGRDSNAE